MKIVVAHNAYRQRGGEDAVVESEVALLRRFGHEVTLLQRHNDELPSIGALRAAADALWSRETRRDALALLQRERPDVVHVHNTFARLSPSLYWACAEAGVPVVQTLHNFRLACPQGMFLRDGRVCEDCLGRWPLPALRHACYRGSRAQSAVMGGIVSLHRVLGTWRDKIAVYIALNEFCRRKFVEAGLPAERLVVKPNFVEAPPPGHGTREGFLFVGRLAPEKGIDTLARAWTQLAPGRSLRVAGDGPLRSRLEGLAGVALLGQVAAHEAMAAMQSAQALVLPSIWYENFPRTLVEAFAAGLPVLASRIGALAEIVVDGQTGLLFAPGDAGALAERMAWAQANPAAMEAMGRRARALYEAEFTPERNHTLLLQIYRRAVDRGAAGR